MSDHAAIWKSLLLGARADGKLGPVMERVARGLSSLTGQTIIYELVRVRKMPIAQVTGCFDALEAETVGIYLRIASGLRGWALLTLPLNYGLSIAELVMGVPRGSAARLGPMERSALAEVGNVTLSYFLNAVASLTDGAEVLQPSPPAVVVDMLAAILELIVTPVAAASDDLVVIETSFSDIGRSVRLCFWVSPDPAELDWETQI